MYVDSKYIIYIKGLNVYFRLYVKINTCFLLPLTAINVIRTGCITFKRFNYLISNVCTHNFLSSNFLIPFGDASKPKA